MKVTETFVRRLTISEVDGLDPIRVMLEDIGPGQGRINIECRGQSWATFWGGMEKKTIAKFVTTCDEHYIAGKLSSMPHVIYTPDGLKEELKRDLLEERRNRFVSGGYARERFNTINELDLPETEEQLWGIARTLEQIIGEEWWYRIPKKPNPDYVYLTRIIKAVQMALTLERPA